MQQIEKRTERSDSERDMGLANRIYFARPEMELKLRGETGSLPIHGDIHGTTWSQAFEALQDSGVISIGTDGNITKKVDRFEGFSVSGYSPAASIAQLGTHLFNVAKNKIDPSTREGQVELLTMTLQGEMRESNRQHETPDFSASAKKIAEHCVDLFQDAAVHSKGHDGYMPYFVDVKLAIIEILKSDCPDFKYYQVKTDGLDFSTHRMVEAWASGICHNDFVKEYSRKNNG
jgi:hypothetical protein